MNDELLAMVGLLWCTAPGDLPVVRTHGNNYNKSTTHRPAVNARAA